MLRARALLACAAVAASVAARGAPLEAAAPIGNGTPGPIRQLFLDPVLSDARDVGGERLWLRLESANSWSIPSGFERGGRSALVQLDAQADALAVALRVPWTRFAAGGWRERVATTVRWRATAFWGGFEDGGIEAWHHLVGAYNFWRNRYGRDALHLRLRDAGGAAAFELDSARVAPGDLVLATQAVVARGGASVAADGPAGAPRWAVAARLDLKLPTGPLGSAGGSGNPDAAVAVQATAEVAPWLIVHGMLLGEVTGSLASPIALQPRRWHGGVDVSVAVLLWGFTFLAEDRWLTPLMEGGWSPLDGGNDDAFLSSAYNALFRSHNQASFGLRRAGWTLSFSEDFTLGNNPRAYRSWFFSSNAPDTVLALTFTVPL